MINFSISNISLVTVDVDEVNPIIFCFQTSWTKVNSSLVSFKRRIKNTPAKDTFEDEVYIEFNLDSVLESRGG